MRLKNGDKILVTHRAVRHQHKAVPQGTVLTVSTDIDAKDANLLIGIKRATTDLDWKPPSKSAKSKQT
ncbi:MAG: hypothetical protein WBW16_03030 [Bacteroidota bacterium]